MKIRVYAINISDLDIDVLSLTDDQFIEEAEQQGLVWSLKGFESAFNSEEVSSQWFIRIIN